MTKKERPTFEDALEKLEMIVNQLGDQSITLENATLKIEQIDQRNNSNKEEANL